MKYVAIISLIFLVSCGDDIKTISVEVPKPVVFIPDDRFFLCPSPTLPNPNTLTDVQVSTLLVQYDSANKVCKSSLNGIRSQLLDAKSKFQK